MRVVVTGASGNVGTSVLDALASDRSVEEIVALARRIPAATFAKTRWQSADVSSSELGPLFAGADVVIHLAWLIQPSRETPVTRSVNVQGSRRVFDAVARAGVPALVHASSVGAYAPGPRAGSVDETWPTTGVRKSFYSRQKAEVERLLDGFEASHPEVRVARLRPALTFKRDSAQEMRRLFVGPLLARALARAGRLPALPYPRGLRAQAVHSFDVGEAYRLAATRPVSGAFNIAAEDTVDARSLGRLLDTRTLPLPVSAVRALAWASWKLRLQPTSPGWLELGMRSPIMAGERARRELGWTPRFTAMETLLELSSGLPTDSILAEAPRVARQPVAGARVRWHQSSRASSGPRAAHGRWR